jgi:hypothetical protein
MTAIVSGGLRDPSAKATAEHSRLVGAIQYALALISQRLPYHEIPEKFLRDVTWGHCYVVTEAAYHLFGRAAGSCHLSAIMGLDEEHTGG